MTRTHKIAFAQKVIADMQTGLARAYAKGVQREADDYTWQEMLYEDTLVDIKDVNDLEACSDQELAKIVKTYI